MKNGCFFANIKELNRAIDDLTLFDDDLMSCESFTRLANKVGDERAEQTTIKDIKLMMKNFKCSLEEALDALEIKGKERAIIAKQLQK